MISIAYDWLMVVVSDNPEASHTPDFHLLDHQKSGTVSWLTLLPLISDLHGMI